MSVLFTRRGATPVTSIELSNYAVGDSVFLNVNGTPTEFLVVQQGIPSNSSLYDTSCNGTWLLMKDIYEKREWGTMNQYYATSGIHTYLNGTFLGLFASEVQSAIKQVKIPYRTGVALDKTVGSGANGLSTKVFALGCYEVGWTTSTNSSIVVDGGCLDYFKGLSSSDSKRIAYLNGKATHWWVRSPFSGFDGDSANFVGSTGGTGTGMLATSRVGIRPALILPFTATFDPETNVFLRA